MGLETERPRKEGNSIRLADYIQWELLRSRNPNFDIWHVLLHSHIRRIRQRSSSLDEASRASMNVDDLLIAILGHIKNGSPGILLIYCFRYVSLICTI
jgi:hypothetical protein